MSAATDESPVAIAAIQLMLLTGFRRMEALALQRDWVDARAGSLRFPQTKIGAQVRPIGRAALQLIAKQPTVNDSSFVFPGEEMTTSSASPAC